MANLKLRKEKKQLPQSLKVVLDFDTVLALSNIRSEDKEGPNTKKRDSEGIGRKVKEKATLVGTKPSCESAIKEQIKEHLKKEKEPPC